MFLLDLLCRIVVNATQDWVLWAAKFGIICQELADIDKMRFKKKKVLSFITVIIIMFEYKNVPLSPQLPPPPLSPIFSCWSLSLPPPLVGLYHVRTTYQASDKGCLINCLYVVLDQFYQQEKPVWTTRTAPPPASHLLTLPVTVAVVWGSRPSQRHWTQVSAVMSECFMSVPQGHPHYSHLLTHTSNSWTVLVCWCYSLTTLLNEKVKLPLYCLNC